MLLIITAAEIMDHDRRVSCPECGRTLLREEYPIVNGWRRVKAHCAYCEFQQVAGCGPDGEMRFFELDETPPMLKRSKAEIDAEQRRKELIEMAKRCAAPGCEFAVKCYGLCNMHQARWHGANKPKMEDWLAAGAPTPGEWAKRNGGPHDPTPRADPAVAEPAALPKARPKPVAAEAAHEPAAKPEPEIQPQQQNGAPKTASRTTPGARPVALRVEPQKPLTFIAAEAAHQLLQFEWPVEALIVMRTGDYITLTDETGRVMGQIHIGAIASNTEAA